MPFFETSVQEIKYKVLKKVAELCYADQLKPELDVQRKEAGSLAKSDEDVLSFALFPQVAAKFLEERNNPKKSAPVDSNGVRTLIVEDLSC